jgi:hypothetical protein
MLREAASGRRTIALIGATTADVAGHDAIDTPRFQRFNDEDLRAMTNLPLPAPPSQR